MIMDKWYRRDAAGVLNGCLHARATLVILSACALMLTACSVLEPSNVAVSQPPVRTTTSANLDPSRSSASPSNTKAPLAGFTVGVDAGHNGHNHLDPSYIDRLIWNGREQEACDTAGTETDAGYTEPRFTFRVATFLRTDLLRDGSQVVMTRTNNHGLGPCVNSRAEIINRGHANVAIDIHADGGPPSGRGFAILEPVPDGPNNKVIGASKRFGRDVRWAFLRYTAMPVSTYDGVNGIAYRNDLAGLNLTRVPKVLIECGNMRNAKDARMLVSGKFQRLLAYAMEAAIIRFLNQH
jgi:N-acetylmuramoyl-L-alanine amidase